MLSRLFAATGLALACTLVAIPRRSAAQEFFQAGDISTFDGKTFGNLTIGTSTTADIKKAYKTSKGAIRPEAMLMPQPESSKVRVDVLTNGRGEGSVLSGFRLLYSDAGPDLKAVSAALKLDPEVWYPKQHFDDWYVAAFPEKGIVMFIEGAGRTERCGLVLLCTPFHVRDAIQDCVKQPTPSDDIAAAFPTSQRVVEVGFVNVFINTSGGVKVEKSGDVSSTLENRIKRMRTPREVDIQSSAKGVINVRIVLTNNSKDRRVDVDVSADLTGTTVLGKVATSSRYSTSQRVDEDNPVWRDADRLERAMYGAVDRLMDRTAEAVRKQPLPTPMALRLKACDAMIDKATK